MGADEMVHLTSFSDRFRDVAEATNFEAETAKLGDLTVIHRIRNSKRVGGPQRRRTRK